MTAVLIERQTGASPSHPAPAFHGRRRRRDISPREPATDVFHISAECQPLARTGGLGEAVCNLARHQAGRATRTTVIMPLHRAVRVSGTDVRPTGVTFEVPVGSRFEPARLQRARLSSTVTVILIEHDGFFDRAGLYGEAGVDYADNLRRFAFFCRAALRAVAEHEPATAVVHAHDWHAALAPVFLKTEFRDDVRLQSTASVLSIHNAAFQGCLPRQEHDDEGLRLAASVARNGHLNLLRMGIEYADAVVTVSPTHREELRTPLGGFGLDQTFAGLGDRFVGILNGIDAEEWNPRADPHIVARYDRAHLAGKALCKVELQRVFSLPEHADVPVIAMCARLTEQKGIDLLLGAIPEDGRSQLIVMGEGEVRYEEGLNKLARRFPDRIGIRIGFDDAEEHRLLAGADVLLMPSRFEPCGLTQMRAQRYGVVPVARRVGGLADTVSDGVTGFLFDDYSAAALAVALRRALDAYATPTRWNPIMLAAMERDFGWARAVDQYRDVYRRALKQRAPRELPALESALR